MRFNLRDNSTVIVTSNVPFPTLAEDVTSNCLYYIKSRNIISVDISAGQTGGHCPYSYRIENTGKHYNVSLHITMCMHILL